MMRIVRGKSRPRELTKETIAEAPSDAAQGQPVQTLARPGEVDPTGTPTKEADKENT